MGLMGALGPGGQNIKQTQEQFQQTLSNLQGSSSLQDFLTKQGQGDLSSWFAPRYIKSIGKTPTLSVSGAPPGPTFGPGIPIGNDNAGNITIDAPFGGSTYYPLPAKNMGIGPVPIPQQGMLTAEQSKQAQQLWTAALNENWNNMTPDQQWAAVNNMKDGSFTFSGITPPGMTWQQQYDWLKQNPQAFEAAANNLIKNIPQPDFMTQLMSGLPLAVGGSMLGAGAFDLIGGGASAAGNLAPVEDLSTQAPALGLNAGDVIAADSATGGVTVGDLGMTDLTGLSGLTGPVTGTGVDLTTLGGIGATTSAPAAAAGSVVLPGAGTDTLSGLLNSPGNIVLPSPDPTATASLPNPISLTPTSTNTTVSPNSIFISPTAGSIDPLTGQLFTADPLTGGAIPDVTGSIASGGGGGSFGGSEISSLGGDLSSGSGDITNFAPGADLSTTGSDITGVLGNTAKTAGSAASSAWDLVKKYGKEAASFGPLAMAALSYLTGGNQKIPSQGQLTANAQNASDLANKLIGNYQSGTLTPGQQATIDQFRQKARSEFQQYLLTSGQGTDSSAMAQMDQQIDSQAAAMAQQFLQQGLQDGLQALGIADNQLTALSQLQLEQDTQAQNTLSSFMSEFFMLQAGVSPRGGINITLPAGSTTSTSGTP